MDKDHQNASKRRKTFLRKKRLEHVWCGACVTTLSLINGKVAKGVVFEDEVMQAFGDAEDNSKNILLFALEILCRCSNACKQKDRENWPIPFLYAGR